jgi:hypothetical protein
MAVRSAFRVEGPSRFTAIPFFSGEETMKIDPFSWILGGAKKVLAALAILAVFSLATPSASASVSLFYEATQGVATPIPSTMLTSGVSSGSQQIGDVQFTVTATSTDSSSASNLTTTTIAVTNVGTTAETLDLSVTGIGFSAGKSGDTMTVDYAMSGSGGPATKGVDTITVNSAADAGNGKYVMTTPVGAMTGVPNKTTSSTIGYAFPDNSGVGNGPGSSASVTFLRGGVFSLTQTLAITLGAKDQGSFTFTTTALPPTPVLGSPEPSSLVIGGIGALGMLGYGLRRRKALGA